MSRLLAPLLALALSGGVCHGQVTIAELSEALVLPRTGPGGRRPLHPNAVHHSIAVGSWSTPAAGDDVTTTDGESVAWVAAEAGDDGWLSNRALRGGHAFWPVEAVRAQVAILEASGHSAVWINGTWRAGDPYRTGWLMLPVELRAGANEVLFHCGRGAVRAKLTEPPSDAFFNLRDVTLPDAVLGEKDPLHAGLIVVNATTRSRDDLVTRAVVDDASETIVTTVPAIPPLSTRKVVVTLPRPALAEPGRVEVTIDLVSGSSAAADPLDSHMIALRVCHGTEKHRRTFISAIDGSCQYYAVTPQRPGPDDAGPPALFLTLHGAGVEATGQANAYGHKDWGVVVAPTNRRHFGFDWEDWGRLDALEVLEHASARYGSDPDRIYLTGHSMGGHGTWQLGMLFPDRFAAIAPSAGWISFWSYTGAEEFENETPLENIFRRAVGTSDTRALSRNYLHHGVYILHGDRDDNVPVAQARTMREHLGTFHPDFAYYERPGAGHWWGNQCVDWPPLFDFFAHHRRTAPAEVRHIELHTANPGVSARSHWVTIEQQSQPLAVSSITIDFDPEKRQFRAETTNVERLSVDARQLGLEEPASFEIDGMTLADAVADARGRINLEQSADGWTVADALPMASKGPHRHGPFKDAFRHDMVFVYGTAGTPEENRWSYDKARFDAETFWFRGNGSVELIADSAFDPAAHSDRGVILYGNAESNAAWTGLLAESPIQVTREAVRVGEEVVAGADLACLFVRPRPDSERACVAVVGGTGLAGLRTTDRLAYFVSGIGYPDWMVLDAGALRVGLAGVRAAGYFGNDWSLDAGDVAWRE